MALQPGATLGSYEVLSLIGAGGMGEVYRARDPRLNREVAIKVLPVERVADENRRRRFVQEAQAASALNHSHIITIHEIASAHGNDFIVMEYIRGKSLDALIRRRGMRLDEVVRVAIPIADALAAAHARGIIHRDLKPAIVMVGEDGAVKVLDFGLAKLVGTEAPTDQETVTGIADAGLSMPGAIVGTPAYMSPEQATAGKVDARSDIFSFGAILYEMVTGARAFGGTSVADTLSAVLHTQPTAPTALVATVPRELETVILRCLRKEPERRFQCIADVTVALQDIKEDIEAGTPRPTGPARTVRPSLIVALAALTLLSTVIAWWWPHRQANPPSPRVVPLTTLSGHESWPTFSPDGSQVAFVWRGEKDDNADIYVKYVGSPEVRRLTSDVQPDTGPSWSPDGRHIAYVHDARPGDNAGRIHLLSALGGSDLKLSDLAVSPPLAWSADGRYLAAQHVVEPADSDEAGIYVIPVRGGAPRRLALSRAPALDPGPAFSPDGRQLAYGSCNGVRCDVNVVDVRDDLVPAARPRRLSSAFLTSLAWTRDGKSVVYNDFVDVFVSYLWRVSAEGNRAPERIEIAGQGATMPATVSSTDRLAFARVSYDTDVYRFEAGRPAQPVLTSTFSETEPRLSVDGNRLAFASSRSGRSEIWVAKADGTAAQPLTDGPGSQQGSPSWSPDGRRIAFDSFGDDWRYHIWIVDADGGPPVS